VSGAEFEINSLNRAGARNKNGFLWKITSGSSNETVYLKTESHYHVVNSKKCRDLLYLPGYVAKATRVSAIVGTT